MFKTCYYDNGDVVWTAFKNDHAYQSYTFQKKEVKPEVVKETSEEKVIRFLKGDFEKQIGMSFDEFTKIRNEIIEKCPEKLI